METIMTAQEAIDKNILTLSNKQSLKKIYNEWYSIIRNDLNEIVEGTTLEIGCGPSYMDMFIPNLMCTDIVDTAYCEEVLDACGHWDIEDNSLEGIVMVNVLHHLPNVFAFLENAQRTLKPGGVISMIEPWNTPFSKLIYKFLHHERFDPKAKTWWFDSKDPYYDANGALPWIVFERDARHWEYALKKLKIEKVDVFMPLSYLLTGGMSKYNLLPARFYNKLRKFENIPFVKSQGMFANIKVVKK